MASYLVVAISLRQKYGPERGQEFLGLRFPYEIGIALQFMNIIFRL